LPPDAFEQRTAQFAMRNSEPPEGGL